MNIIEAIKSGRKYRRIGEKNWYESAGVTINYLFPLKSILADDWEVEQTYVTITREQFDQAWDENIPIGESYGETMRYLLAKALGF